MALRGGQVSDPGLQQTLDDLDQRLQVLETYDFTGKGSPENVVTAPVGATYRSLNGGILTTFYVKTSGGGPPATNTGWTAK